jgi:hypothetical protein
MDWWTQISQWFDKPASNWIVLLIALVVVFTLRDIEKTLRDLRRSLRLRPRLNCAGKRANVSIIR